MSILDGPSGIKSNLDVDGAHNIHGDKLIYCLGKKNNPYSCNMFDYKSLIGGWKMIARGW